MISCLIQLSEELGFPIRPKANLTFSKCLEMKLQDHIGIISKVAEVAGKEYSIEQVSSFVLWTAHLWVQRASQWYVQYVTQFFVQVIGQFISVSGSMVLSLIHI